MKITNITQLRDIYGEAKGRAKSKVLPALEKHGINFINQSPFMILSSVSADGKMDASPRGGQQGFVKVLDKQTILVPDAKGNNRVDSLGNIVETGKVGCLFMVPGIDETLRLNGTCHITTDAEMLAHFAADTKAPITVLVIEIEEVFLHCAKAFMRSKLWDASAQVNPDDFPTMGRMLKDQLGVGELESREDMRKRYAPDL